MCNTQIRTLPTSTLPLGRGQTFPASQQGCTKGDAGSCVSGSTVPWLNFPSKGAGGAHLGKHILFSMCWSTADRWVSYRLIGRRKATTASLQQTQSQMESYFTWKMPACFVKAGLGTAQSSAKSSDLPGKCKCCDRWQRQALCSDFVSKPVSSPPSTLPKQTSGNTTLPQAYPRDNPAARQDKKHISSSGSGLKDPLWICTGETFAPLPSLSARRMRDARTQREGTMTNVLESSSCAWEASF